MNIDDLNSLPSVRGLRILPLGGLGEIGMNCMILEWEDEIILIDCGLMFSDLDHFGVEFVVPDFSYLVARKDRLKAIIITHGHEDHVGAIPFALRAGLNVPIYASAFSSMLIKSRLEENGLLATTDLRVFKMGDRIQFKRFGIEPVSVNHSIVDAAALIIDTPIGKVIHTGDFKIDPTPFYGNTLDLNRFKQVGDEGVVLMLSDSTNVERCEHNFSENVIYQKFEQLLAAAEGLTVISMFASNVSRIGQVFKLAKQMDKKVYLAGRGMEQNSRFAHEIGYLAEMPSVVIAHDDLDRYSRKDVIVLSAGSQAEPRSGLMRMALNEHRDIQLEPGDRVLMSSRTIPGNEKAISRMINQLFKQGADVLYESVHDIHVSGHATRPELKQMLDAIRPKYFIPIHGEYRHLVHHARLARETGVEAENVLVVGNGEVVEVESDRFEKVARLDDPKILIESRAGDDISRTLLKERRHLGEKGVVFALLVRNVETAKIIAGPEIIAKGVAHESREDWLLEEAKVLVQRVLVRYEEERKQGMHVAFDLQETVRVELRRYFGANVGKKPPVIVFILDV